MRIEKGKLSRQGTKSVNARPVSTKFVGIGIVSGYV